MAIEPARRAGEGHGHGSTIAQACGPCRSGEYRDPTLRMPLSPRSGIVLAVGPHGASPP